MDRRMAEYDREASSYDETRFHSKLGRHLDHLHKRIVGVLLPRSGRLVLDAGVGTGRFAKWLSGRGYEIIGVDISREMLKEAKREARIMHLNVGLVLADASDLPFRRESFDICTSINVIDHVPDIGRLFGQVRYVIKPNGSYVFNFSNLQSPYLLFAIIVNLRKRALSRKGWIQSKWSTLKKVHALMSRNGFEIKEIRGCFIASNLPLGDRLADAIRLINLSIENSRLKLFSGSLFVKAQLINPSVLMK